MKETMKDLARGSIRSWTIWFGALLLALPDIINQLGPDLLEVLGSDGYSRLLRIAGVAAIVLRFKTTQPIAQKGRIDT